jgi:hypothetical protein
MMTMNLSSIGILTNVKGLGWWNQSSVFCIAGR